jgi:hypothetical protein
VNGGDLLDRSSIMSGGNRKSGNVLSQKPLAKVLPFMVRYLTTNGESAVCNPTSPFAPRYRRARREFCDRLSGMKLYSKWNT